MALKSSTSALRSFCLSLHHSNIIYTTEVKIDLFKVNMKSALLILVAPLTAFSNATPIPPYDRKFELENPTVAAFASDSANFINASGLHAYQNEVDAADPAEVLGETVVPK